MTALPPDPEAFVRASVAASWSNDPAVSRYFADDYVIWDNANRIEHAAGTSASWYQWFQGAFRESSLELDEVYQADGDRVVAHFRLTGIGQLEAYGPVPAAGHSACWQGVMIHRFRDGKIVERVDIYDSARPLRQLRGETAFP